MQLPVHTQPVPAPRSLYARHVRLRVAVFRPHHLEGQADQLLIANLDSLRRSHAEHAVDDLVHRVVRVVKAEIRPCVQPHIQWAEVRGRIPMQRRGTGIQPNPDAQLGHRSRHREPSIPARRRLRTRIVKVENDDPVFHRDRFRAIVRVADDAPRHGHLRAKLHLTLVDHIGDHVGMKDRFLRRRHRRDRRRWSAAVEAVDIADRLLIRVGERGQGVPTLPGDLNLDLKEAVPVRLHQRRYGVSARPLDRHLHPVLRRRSAQRIPSVDDGRPEVVEVGHVERHPPVVALPQQRELDRPQVRLQRIHARRHLHLVLAGLPRRRLEVVGEAPVRERGCLVDLAP